MQTDGSDDLAALLRELQSRVPMDAAELLARESPSRIEQALAALPAEFAGRVRAHLLDVTQTGATPIATPETVRDLMEPARAVFAPETTVADAIEFLRHAGTVSDITYLYVIDSHQRLSGFVVMRDMLLATPQQTLAQVMLHAPFSLNADMPIGDAVRAAFKRHYPVYPVCGADGRLAGLVRGWKLFEQQAVEISAQSGRMVGVGSEERVGTSIWNAFRMRHPWLQFNLLTAFLAAFVVGSFEDTISRIVALAAFLPVLAGQSGNNGCQALAITLRGYTLGDMENQSVPRLLYKEAALGFLNGLFTGVVAGLAMWWSAGRDGNAHAVLLGGVIMMAMTGACMLSGVFGVLVPLLLKRFGADPVTASSIFLTTGTDIASMGLMLTLATTLVP
jgi:magnesium transporter